MKREVVLHSMAAAAVDATTRTLRLLGGVLTVDGNRAFVEGSDFVFWAAVRQGYVKKLLGADDD